MLHYVITLSCYYIVSYYVIMWRSKLKKEGENEKIQYSRVTISIYPILISSDPHPDSLNFKPKDFWIGQAPDFTWRGCLDFKRVFNKSWTTSKREHSTEAEQQVSGD